MAETKPKRTAFVSPARRKLAGKKVDTHPLPSLEEITPARFARLNSLQRRELTLKLIEFLKTL